MKSNLLLRWVNGMRRPALNGFLLVAAPFTLSLALSCYLRMHGCETAKIVHVGTWLGAGVFFYIFVFTRPPSWGLNYFQFRGGMGMAGMLMALVFFVFLVTGGTL
jgi:hypothetical protein